MRGLIGDLAAPVLMTALAVLVTVTEPSIFPFIVVDVMLCAAAAVYWWQFAAARLRPGWREHRERGRDG